LWNGSKRNRRILRTQLIVDVPDDYEPSKQVRDSKRKRQSTTTNDCLIEAKKKRMTSIKCANGCGAGVADDDPAEVNAIQCCHQREYYPRISENCSRWLCNTCRVKLGISTETISWFCKDCADMHLEDDDEEEEEE
jgi:hypothetical protein